MYSTSSSLVSPARFCAVVLFSAGDTHTPTPHTAHTPVSHPMSHQMIGIWCLVTWMHLGQAPALQLVELGPGRGTLMSDLLRGTAGFESFSNALSVHLVELSPALRQLQYRALRWVLAGWARVGEGQIIVCRVA